jgi:branched-chain amino acid transport system substrate-binding protein
MRKIEIGVCVILLICFVIFPVSAGGKVEEKEKIVIGAARSLSGPLAVVESSAFGPIFKMWVDEVNAEGGIYIEEYGKKLPIETLIYDDKSDIGTMTRLLEKLIVEDKVDFVFPSDSTAMLFAAAPVANKYGYILLGMEGGATKIKEIISGLPYFFSALNFSDHYQVPVLADGMAEWGVKSAAIVFIADLHGVEYSSVAVPELALKGIDIVMTKSIPPGIKDMSPIIKEAKAANVDAFLCFAYPDENILATKQSMELGFNPKLFLTGPGANFGFFAQIFGPAVNGIMSWGAWNAKSSPAHRELAEKLIELYGEQAVDWWGHNLYYAALQFWTQAVEKAGTLDQAKIRDIMENETFNTILGPTWFDENHLLAVDCHSGELGQWQNGVFEVIGPKEKATAPPIYPKPPWPKM